MHRLDVAYRLALCLWMVASPRVLVAQQAASQPATATASAPQDPGNNNYRSTEHDVHALLIDESAKVFRLGSTGGVIVEARPAGVAIRKARGGKVSTSQPARATHTSRVIEAEFPFNDVVPSWNVDVPDGCGFAVELRFGRARDDFWTPWYYLGMWGAIAPPATRHVKDEHGTVAIDCFGSKSRFDRLQYRFALASTSAERSPVIRRVAIAYSNTLGDEALARTFRKPCDPGPKTRWARRLPVPYRSQSVEDEKIRHSICSPTCVAMVLQYFGVTEPTAKVCATIWDDEYKLYGTWPRAVQGAYAYGVVGYLERFGDWNAVKRHIAAGRPVIASIRVDRDELKGAPYRYSDGHLLVITGFDEKGDVCVNDPAAKTAEQGQATYSAADMKKVWLDRGGVGYVFTGRARR